MRKNASTSNYSFERFRTGEDGSVAIKSEIVTS